MCIRDRYVGDYDKFREVYEVKKAQLEAAYKRQQQEIAELQDFVARNKARVSTRNMATVSYTHLLPAEEAAVRKVMSQMEDWLFDAFLPFERCLFSENAEQAGRAEELCRQIRTRGDCIRMKDMKVTGNDLIEAGVKQGKAVGEACLLYTSRCV